MSMISEQIKELEELQKAKEDGKDVDVLTEIQIVGNACDTIRKLSAKLHEANMHGGWVPTDERLPEVGEFVLVCFDNGEIAALWQDWKINGTQYMDYDDDAKEFTKNAVAWMPFPDQYEGVAAGSVDSVRKSDEE